MFSERLTQLFFCAFIQLEHKHTRVSSVVCFKCLCPFAQRVRILFCWNGKHYTLVLKLFGLVFQDSGQDAAVQSFHFVKASFPETYVTNIYSDEWVQFDFGLLTSSLRMQHANMLQNQTIQLLKDAKFTVRRDLFKGTLML